MILSTYDIGLLLSALLVSSSTIWFVVKTLAIILDFFSKNDLKQRASQLQVNFQYCTWILQKFKPKSKMRLFAWLLPFFSLGLFGTFSFYSSGADAFARTLIAFPRLFWTP